VTGGDDPVPRSGELADLVEPAEASSISAADAGEHSALLSAFVGVDNPVSSAVTRKVLGWEPAHPGLIEDLEYGHYFRPS